MKSETQHEPFRKILHENKVVRVKLSRKEIDKALNPKSYLGTSLKQIEIMIEKTKSERKKRETKTRGA